MAINQTFRSPSIRAGALAAVLGLTAVLGAACATADPDPALETPAPEPAAAVEAAGATPRLAVSYDGGVLVLDASTLEPLYDADVEGFTRLSPAGDGRHVLVSAGDRFATLDLGAWSEAHGSHSHHYTAEPRLTGADFPAKKPGHVVPNGGRTALFDDGDGLVRIFDPRDLADGLPAMTSHPSAEAHHGVAVPLADGGLITTIGDATSRSGITVLDGEGRELTRNEACPGLHGEAVAQDAVVFGCEDGVLVYRDGAITQIPSPDAYGRIGNQAGSAVSDVVLGDYKVDKSGELERPERVMLVDTATMALRPVDLGTSYSFRSLGRGPAGEALVLGTDGALHVIDPATGEVIDKIAVVAPWTESEVWQEPRPTLFVEGATAYVTEPSTQSIHAVDLETGAVTATRALPQTPNELTGIAG
ncbi:zinc metallochaperone AztD [Tomitella biformata]|uniref:zinc metallochaperone AztD n=1 Tax=Tomitella biformata TaxID=630403 RepID=UPI0004663DA9|nr:zinc metallochaperone AztD [Tomitella biformata]